MLLLATALAFVALGQLVVLLTGNIDLSVGPLMGLIVGRRRRSSGPPARAPATLAARDPRGDRHGARRRARDRAAACASGGSPSVLASLATYIVIQGVALLLRPQEAGELRTGITARDQHGRSAGCRSRSIVAVVVAVVAEVLLRRSRAGLELRAVGSDETRAHRLGARVNLDRTSSPSSLCSLFAAAAGIMLAGQIGIGDGDPTLSTNYTLHEHHRRRARRREHLRRARLVHRRAARRAAADRDRRRRSVPADRRCPGTIGSRAS